MNDEDRWRDRLMKVTKSEEAELKKILYEAPNGPCFIRVQELRGLRIQGVKGGHAYCQGNLRFDLASTGAIMEDEGQLLEAANREMEKSRQLLRDTASQITKMADITIPILTDQVTHLRSLRMAITKETETTVEALREVSEFFIEHDYEAEMQRLQRFVGLCEQLKALKQDGTLDALSDTIIRLAYKEQSR